LKQCILGIFDYEIDYANNLMEYLNQKSNFHYEICLFTSIERLNAYLQENRMEVLLICESALDKMKDSAKITNILILSEEENMEEGQYPSIFKFQSAERIYFSLVASLDQNRNVSNQDAKNESRVKFFGVISPNGGSGKTTFSLAFAEAVAKTERTLYLNFESLGSSIFESKNKGGMSDVIYYLKQRQKGILKKIQSMATTIAGVDCIFAVTHYGDLHALEKEDMDFLMEELIKTQVYQNIVFDFGNLNEIVFYILERCKKIYVTHLKDNSSISKETAFQKLFCFEEKEALMNRMAPLMLPWDIRIANGDYKTDQLLEGELGKFINELLYRTSES